MKALLAMLVAFGIYSTAFAAKPRANPREDGAYARAGKAVWGQTEYIAAAGEWIPMGVAPVDTSSDAESAAPKLFEYGTIVMVTCDVDALGFWAHDIGTTTATTGLATDSGSLSGRTSGPNAFWIEAGVTRHTVVPTPPQRGNEGVHSESQVSLRVLSCEDTGTANSTTALAVAGRPCDADADCFHIWDATCTDTGLPTGSYLKIHPTAAAQCSIEVEH